MAFISGAPHVHLGLVMVADGHQGRGLQKLCLLNVGAAHLDWLTLRYHVSDLGYSSRCVLFIHFSTIQHLYSNACSLANAPPTKRCTRLAPSSDDAHKLGVHQLYSAARNAVKRPWRMPIARCLVIQ
jgi:hypothetical protein